MEDFKRTTEGPATLKHGSSKVQFIGFVGGLPLQTTLEELREYVLKFGAINHLSLPVDSNTRSHKGFAKVFFKRQEGLLKAITQRVHKIHGVDFGFSEWVPKKQHISKKEQPSENKLFFKMNGHLEEEQVLNHFKSFGKVELIEIKTNYITGESRDIGFVVFATAEDAKKALNFGSKHHVKNAKLLVQPSKTIKQIVKEGKAKSRQSGGVLNIMKNDHLEPQQTAFLKSGPLTIRASVPSSFQKFKQMNNKVPSLSGKAKNNTSFLNHECIRRVDADLDIDPIYNHGISSNCAKPSSKEWTHWLVEANHHRKSNLKLRFAKSASTITYA